MERGCATKQEGEGASEVLPLQKGGIGKVLAILKGEDMFWGSFNTGARSFNLTGWWGGGGGTNGFHPLRGGT